MTRLPLAAALLLLAAPMSAQNAPRSDAAAESASSTPDPGGTKLARVDFREVPLSDACRMISDASGLNVVPSQGAATHLVSLYLRDVTALQAVDSLCSAYQLWSRRDATGGTVHLSTVDEYQRDLSDLREERTEYFTLLYPNVFDVGYAIRNLFGSRVVLRASDADGDTYVDLMGRLRRFDILDQRTQGLGLSAINGGGYGGYGGGYGGGGYGGYGNSGGYGGGGYGGGYGGGGYGGYGTSGGYGGYGGGFGNTNGSGLVGAQDLESQEESATGKTKELTAADVYQLEQLLAQHGADAETKLADEVDRLYQAPIRVTIARRQNKLVVRTSDDQALQEIRRLVERLDVPTALVLLDVRILSVDLLDGKNTFFEYQWSDSPWSGAFSTGNIATAAPPLLGPAGTGLQTGNLIFQYVSDTFAARMQALEQSDHVRTVSTPMLLTANNEVSRLFVGKEVPLNRSFSGGTVVSNESTTNTVSGSTDIEFRPVGTTLLITPSINADRTVLLKIVQESSDVNSTATILVPSGDDFENQTVNIVSSQTVSGTIVAKSELSVAFGGLIETATTTQEEKIPFLGDIPFLGVLFRRDVKSETRRELVIVVRPYVLGTPADYEASSRRLLASLGTDTGALDLRGGTPPAENARLRFEILGIDPEHP